MASHLSRQDVVKRTVSRQLYDIGFDAPETHAIRKDQTMYYAFFARRWKGPVELRGLDDRDLGVVDYVTGKDLGMVSGHSAHLPVEFDGNLLVERATTINCVYKLARVLFLGGRA